MAKKARPFAEALEEFCREFISPDLVRAADPEPDRVVVNIDDQIVIQAGRDEWIGRDAEPFVIGDKHNLYEWAMVLAVRHPRSAFWYGGPGTGVDDETRKDIRVAAIGLREESQTIFETLVAAYESGKIRPVPGAWYKKQPADLTLLVFRQDDILDVISELGADGEAIRLLMAKRKRRTNRQMDAARNEAEPIPAQPMTSKSAEPPRKARVGRPPKYNSRPDVRGLLERVRSDPQRGLAWVLSLRPKDRRELVRRHITSRPLPRDTRLNEWINEYLNEFR